MQVVDRRGLEAHSCECYGVVQQAYERLRSDSPVWPRGSRQIVSGRARAAGRAI